MQTTKLMMIAVVAMVLAVAASADSALPDGYVHLEYVSSDGRQCVDTGVGLTAKTVLAFYFEPMQIETTISMHP